MLFLSTRNEKIKVDAAKALSDGIAEDGGLFVPVDIGSMKFPVERLNKTSGEEILATVLTEFFGEGLFVGSKDVYSDFFSLVKRAYGKGFKGDYAPLIKSGDKYVVELYHGPTAAFKDVALQILPHLAIEAKKAEKSKDALVFLTATSGDTGGAALEGFSDVEGTKVVVFYPKNGTSKVQERQMVSCTGKNAFVFAVEGNFDDAQSGVKKALGEVELGDGVRLSSANSINIGRLVPQISYYFKAYSDLLKRGEINAGDKINFVVPTGNFGDIFAGYFALRLGLPIGKLVCASNKNKVLSDFLKTGVYDVNREFFVTNAPSMDILISSNLERLLYYVCGAEKTAEYMKSLKEKGRYEIDGEELAEIREIFDYGYADEDEVLKTIKEEYEERGYLIDTHTAVAVKVFEDKKKELSGATVILSTASPYKFSTSVLKALGEEENDEFKAVDKLEKITGAPVPDGLKGIEKRKVLHDKTVKKDGITAVVEEIVKTR